MHLSRLVTCALLAGCSSTTETTAAPRPASGPIALGTPAEACPVDEDTTDLEKHACLHATKGPFATASASAEAAAPAVSKPHTMYTVTVDGTAQWLAYKARTEGVYAFYSNPKTRVALRGGNGEQLPTICEGPTSGSCEALPYKAYVRLAAGEDIRIALFPEASGSVKLVIEDID